MCWGGGVDGWLNKYESGGGSTKHQAASGSEVRPDTHAPSAHARPWASQSIRPPARQPRIPQQPEAKPHTTTQTKGARPCLLACFSS